MEPLIDRYPELMDMAVKMALGEDGNKPNTTVLMKLLEIPIKLIPPEELQDETGQQRLLKRLVDTFSGKQGDLNITIAKTANVGGHPDGDGDGTGTPPNTKRGGAGTEPRTMDGSSRHIL